MMKLILDNKENLEQIIKNKIINILDKINYPYLLLSSDNELENIYQKLVFDYENKPVSFQKTKIYSPSEYIKLVKNEDFSLKRKFDEMLISKIDIPLENVHFPKDVKEFNEKLNLVNHFDFALLVIDKDLEIFFNNLESKIKSRTKIVGLSDIAVSNKFENFETHPNLVVTMGINDLLYKTKEIYLLITGKDKEKLLNNLKNNKLKKYSFLNNLLEHKNLTILTDIKLT